MTVSGVALSIRSPQSRHNSSRRSLVGLTHLEIISYETSRPGELPCFRARRFPRNSTPSSSTVT